MDDFYNLKKKKRLVSFVSQIGLFTCSPQIITISDENWRDA